MDFEPELLVGFSKLQTCLIDIMYVFLYEQLPQRVLITYLTYGILMSRPVDSAEYGWGSLMWVTMPYFSLLLWLDDTNWGLQSSLHIAV